MARYDQATRQIMLFDSIEKSRHPSQRLEPMKGGNLKMFLSAADTPELIGWILSFGAGVRVAASEALRDKVRAEAKIIFEQ
jgi:hypothetical protein